MRFRGMPTAEAGSPGSVEHNESALGGNVRHTIGELLTCPFCRGQWVGTDYVAGLALARRQARTWAAVFAVTAVSDGLQQLYDRLRDGWRLARDSWATHGDVRDAVLQKLGTGNLEAESRIPVGEVGLRVESSGGTSDVDESASHQDLCDPSAAPWLCDENPSDPNDCRVLESAQVGGRRAVVLHP